MPCIFQPSSDVTIEWGILQLCRVAELACEHVEVIWGCLFFSDIFAYLGLLRALRRVIWFVVWHRRIGLISSVLRMAEFLELPIPK